MDEDSQVSQFNMGLRTAEEVPVPPDIVHMLSVSLDRTIKGCGQGVFGGQGAFAEWVAQAALLIPYADHCRWCRDEGEPDPRRYPISAEVDQGRRRLRARYRCHWCGEEWQRGWAIGLPMMW